MHFTLTQSGVTGSCKMLVPIYIEYEDQEVVRLGSAVMSGTNTIEQTVTLGKYKAPPKRLVLNYNYDVLSTD